MSPKARGGSIRRLCPKCGRRVPTRKRLASWRYQVHTDEATMALCKNSGKRAEVWG